MPLKLARMFSIIHYQLSILHCIIVHMLPLRHILLLAMLLACGVCIAQKKSAFVRHLTTGDGLSNDICHTVLKDSKGYVWIGTENGLNRYDGHKFQVFKNIPGDSACIAGNTVMELHEDHSGNIWISGVGFLNKYNLQSHRFTHFEANDANPTQHKGGYVEGFFTDRKHRTWLCIAGGGVEQYDSISHRFVGLHPAGKPGALLENFVSGMCETADGRFWLSTHNGLYELSSDLKTFTPHRVVPPKTEENTFYNLATCVLADPIEVHTVWYGTWGTGLHRYNTLTGETQMYTFHSGLPMNLSNIVFDIKTDAAHNIWISSEYGLAQFNRTAGTFEFIDDDVKNPHALRLSEIHNIFFDHDNVLWTSGFKGVNIIDPRLQAFNTRMFGSDFSINNLVYDSKRNRFVGSTFYRNRSLNIFNPIDGSSKGIPLAFAEEGRNEPFGVFVDRKGQYWIGFVRANVRIYQPDEDRMIELPLSQMLNVAERDIDVRSFAEDEQGRIWMSALSIGVLVYDPDAQSLQVLNATSPGVVRGVSELSQNEQFIYAFGENYGIVRIDKQTMEQRASSFNDVPLLKNAVSMVIADNGHLLITTHSHGLIECAFEDAGLKVVKVFDTTQGFPENTLAAILKYSANEYWISCAGGLIMYRPEGVSRLYSENNGLYPFTPNVRLIKGADQHIYYTMGDRLISFYPPELASVSGQFRVVLNSFRVDEKEIFTQDVLGDVSLIELLPGQNSFAFEYSALCFSNVNQLEYAFFLSGAEEEWHYVGDRLYASYSGLAPGDYELRIKTRIAESAWPDAYTSVRIHIAPLWWQTWWFRLSVLVLLVLITLFSIRIYTRSKLRKIELELEKQKSIQQIRTRISRDIHDEIGAGLTKISLMSRKVVRESKGDAAAEAAQSIAGASQQLVKNLGEIVWTINPKNDTLADFLGYVRSYCTDLFEDSGLKLKLDIDEISPQLRSLRLYPEVKRNLLLIIKETLNNALKHSGATDLSLRIAMPGNLLEIEITDNGRGFNPEERGESGNGLRNMKKRSEEVAAEYNIQSTSNGTRTKLTIALDENLL